MDAPLFTYLLRLGDSCLILSHRLCQWCGRGPFLEEDLAISNVALDLLGQARLWLDYAGEVENNGRDADQLAYLRDSRTYHNLLLVEQENGDFAVTMARQLLFDLWYEALLLHLSHSSDAKIAAIAAKALVEVRYHVARSCDWVIRLGDGTPESQQRLQKAFDDLWIYSGELFTTDEVDEKLMSEGIVPDAKRLQANFLCQLEEIFGKTCLKIPREKHAARGGKQGLHGENLGLVLAQMQYYQRAYPGARW